MDPLTDLETQVLTFAGKRWSSLGRKEAACYEAFGFGLTRYGQLLDAVIDKPAALAAEPMLVRRLVRLRQARKAPRTAVQR